MSEHKVNLSWSREGLEFTYKNFSRNHEWDFGNGNVIRATAAPEFLGSPELVDPEQAFVASIASCHALTFLAICALQKIEVDSYVDNAVGHLEKAENGKPWLSKIDLHPQIKFVEGADIDNGKIRERHQKAHSECFLARSVKTSINVN